MTQMQVSRLLSRILKDLRSRADLSPASAGRAPRERGARSGTTAHSVPKNTRDSTPATAAAESGS